MGVLISIAVIGVFMLLQGDAQRYLGGESLEYAAELEKILLGGFFNVPRDL